MKRIIPLFFAVLLLACQPTPTIEPIPNKAEQVMPVELIETDGAVEPPAVPAHVTEQRQPTEHVTVSFDTDVDFDPDAKHPVLEMEALDLVQNDAFLRALAALSGSDGTLYRVWDDPKDVIGERLIAAAEYKGELGSFVYVDEDMLEYLHRAYNSAPDAPERVRVDSPGLGERYYLDRGEGKTPALAVYGMEPNTLFWNLDAERTCYSESSIEPGDPVTVSDPAVPVAEAERVAAEFLARLGVECDCLVKAERAFYIRNFRKSGAIWELTYARSVGGTQSILRPTSFMTKDTPASVGAPWCVESVRIDVDGSEIVSAWFSGLSVTKSVAVKNAKLCEFDTVLDAAARQIGYLHEDPQVPRRWDVTGIALRYGLQTKQDHLDVGLYQPMWEITYVDHAEPDEHPHQLYLSALDGSPVEPRLTVRDLMRYAAWDDPDAPEE